VITEYAKFEDKQTVISDTTRVRAKRFVIATGSRAAAPPVPGFMPSGTYQAAAA